MIYGLKSVCQHHLEDFFKWIARLHPRVSDSICLDLGGRICTSNKITGDANANPSGLGNTLWEPLVYCIVNELKGSRVPSGPFKKAMTMVYTRNDVHFNLGKWEVNQSKEHWGGKIGRSGAGLGVDLKKRKHQENSNELIVLLCHWKGRNSQSQKCIVMYWPKMRILTFLLLLFLKASWPLVAGCYVLKSDNNGRKPCCCGCVTCSVVSNSSASPWTVACQAPLSMEFSRPEYGNGLPLLSSWDFPWPRDQAARPALQVNSLLSGPPGKPLENTVLTDKLWKDCLKGSQKACSEEMPETSPCPFLGVPMCRWHMGQVTLGLRVRSDCSSCRQSW